MALIHRRSFLERVGLGAGAFLLGPVASALVSEARGQMPRRKRAMFGVIGSGIHWDWCFTPTDLAAPGPKAAVLPGRTDFAWPPMVASLAKYRSRTLLVDGLPNMPIHNTGNHASGYSALSGFEALNGGNNERGAPPGNVTIDQYLGAALGASKWRKTVLFGASTLPDTMKMHTFASGPAKPEAQFQSPRALFADVFAPLAGGGSGAAALKQRLLLDSIRTDVTRLAASLAAPERVALDRYLAAMDEFDKRQMALSTVSCTSPPAPLLDATTGTVEDRLESMNEMAILAMICGLTGVAAFAVGCGDSHAYFPTYRRIGKGTQWEKTGVGETGHQPKEVHKPCSDLVHSFNCGLLARAADALSQIKEGDGTMFDNSVMLYLSDNGEYHHAEYFRFPTVIVGNAGGRLRADGRFLRYPVPNGRQDRGASMRSLADLFCSIATACDVPTDSFGKGGNEAVRGPLPELMA